MFLLYDRKFDSGLNLNIITKKQCINIPALWVFDVPVILSDFAWHIAVRNKTLVWQNKKNEFEYKDENRTAFVSEIIGKKVKNVWTYIFHEAQQFKYGN